MYVPRPPLPRAAKHVCKRLARTVRAPLPLTLALLPQTSTCPAAPAPATTGTLRRARRAAAAPTRPPAWGNCASRSRKRTHTRTRQRTRTQYAHGALMCETHEKLGLYFLAPVCTRLSAPSRVGYRRPYHVMSYKRMLLRRRRAKAGSFGATYSLICTRSAIAAVRGVAGWICSGAQASGRWREFVCVRVGRKCGV